MVALTSLPLLSNLAPYGMELGGTEGWRCGDHASGTGRWIASHVSHLQLTTLFGLPWGEDEVLPLTSHQCPTGEPQSHPFKANRTALGQEQRELRRQGPAQPDGNEWLRP